MGDPPANEYLAALECFVVDNDELLQLEERIGRFSIFDALGIVNNEIRHSNFLAWLLDPNESHGLGGLFLKAVLMDLLRQTDPEQRLFSPIQLDGGELRGVQVRREWNHIDLLITCDDPSFVIAIENKIYSSEHTNQLARYQKIITEIPDLAKHEQRQFVYLTREGDEPSEDDWTVYSYADLHRVLSKVRAASGDQMGDDVRTFLDHYLRMIGSRFMDDEKIEELCQTIYKNHRQVLRLIWEKAGAGDGEVIHQLAAIAQQHADWVVLRSTVRWLFLLPRCWEALFNDLKQYAIRSDRPLIVYVNMWQGLCRLAIEVGEFNDQIQRRQLIDRLTADPNEFGLKSKRQSTKYTILFSHTLAKWEDGEEPPIQKCAEAFQSLLEKLDQRLVGVPNALRPIIEQWERERQGKKPTD
ncbi:MAG: PD-(D/E)XK nuclease family protein [Phycisphaeraceae bacterium]|nr:PD-(D/E)XK nuclease family protein [Phycisphaeraceae bacterium]